jgi:hypothetical protein
MRYRRALAVGLLTAVFVGCTTGEPVRSSSWLEQWQAFRGPTGPDVVQMDVALLERPVGDPYLTHELWTSADEQVIAFERRSVLEENGFRIGQVGGITPAGLQALLTSERSCVNPRRIHLHADNPTTVVLGPALAQADFQVLQDGQPGRVTLGQAQCTLTVVPSLTPDGRVRLRFHPQVQHGEAALRPTYAPDGSGLMLQEQRPTQRFPGLAWEVTLAPNEYVVVGARADRPGTLGHRCFVLPEGPAPVQRLLVIRTSRPAGEEDFFQPASTPEGDPLPRRAPPLAYQAARSVVRGQSGGPSDFP